MEMQLSNMAYEAFLRRSVGRHRDEGDHVHSIELTLLP
jgi:hypothetical protein